MDKIKDLSKVIIPEYSVLTEIVKPKRKIILPDGTEDDDSYAVIIAKSKEVTDLEVGDIVIKYGGKLYGYTLKTPFSGEEKIYSIMNRGNINIAVKPDNFVNPDVASRAIKV